MLHEECGVFGIYDISGSDVAHTVYYGLLSLQHRGQESCGIAVSDTSEPKGRVKSHKGMGLVNEVFTGDDIEKLPGNIGIGHVRYSTAGSSTRENAQPLVLEYVKGTLALAHNGNLTNSPELRDDLAYTGAIFQTTIDSELIAYLVARERIGTESVEEAVRKAMRKLHGAYSLVIMSPRKLIGARDPFGFRPLVIGKRDNAWIFASETCALDTVGASYVRDVEPGEIVTISGNIIESDKTMCLEADKQARCIFEYIYFARPDSVIEGVCVHEARRRAGEFLAREYPCDADVVIGVPDSGLDAALGYSDFSGIPYGIGLVKNKYIGRTFIAPTQESRNNLVRLKLGVIAPVLKGKRVVLIDDSIVRGTTMRNLIRMLKESGAKEVHVRISSPPFRYPCYFGTDVPSNEELIANKYSEKELCKVLGADSLAYLPLRSLPEMVNGLPICTGCFDRKYPIDPLFIRP